MQKIIFPDTVKIINIGGGFFGRMHPDMPFKNVPTFDDYARGCLWHPQRKCLGKTESAQRLVIEPGVAMVADTVSFVTKVVSVKTIGQTGVRYRGRQRLSYQADLS